MRSDGAPDRESGVTFTRSLLMPRMSPHRSLAAALAVFITLAACGEQPLAPDPATPDPGALFAKGRSGGNGNPHFTAEGTSCTFNPFIGRLACDYQISGLSASSNGLGSLIANMQLGWDCFYSDASRDYSREVRRVAIDFYYYADESGNAKGYTEGTASGGAFCLAKYISGVLEKPYPSNIRYSLNEMSSPLTLPVIGPAGSWALSAIVSTPKKAGQYIFYIGSWMLQEPE